MGNLQVMNMRTSFLKERKSRLDKAIDGIVDGITLTFLSGGLLAIGAMCGYLLANVV